MTSDDGRLLRLSVAAVVGVVLFALLFVWAFEGAPPDPIVVGSREKAVETARAVLGPEWPGSDVSVIDNEGQAEILERRWLSLWETQVSVGPTGGGWEVAKAFDYSSVAKGLQALILAVISFIAGALVFRLLRPLSR